MRIPIAPEGRVFVLAPLGGALLAFVAHRLLGGDGVVLPALALAGTLLAGFCAFFFRDPERRVQAARDAVLAAADGRVTEVAPTGDGAVRISVFLSLFSVHVNRSPTPGEVVAVRRRSGAFRAAFRQDAAERNEQNEVEIRTGRGMHVRVRQIVGVVARRIVCRVAPGDTLAAGERFGMIRFGSRTDILLPADFRILVRPGDRVRAGLTPVARLR